MGQEPDAFRSCVLSIEAMIRRLQQLTPEDRAEGWQEQTSHFLISHFQDTLISIQNDQAIPEWMCGRSVLMTLENPGVLSGPLKDEVVDLADVLDALR